LTDLSLFHTQCQQGMQSDEVDSGPDDSLENFLNSDSSACVTVSNGDWIDSEKLDGGDMKDFNFDIETGHVVHTVRSVDTLQGLSLMYGVKVQAIKVNNSLWNDNIIVRKQLLIPVTKEELHAKMTGRKRERQEKMSAFVCQAGVTPEVAKKYLVQSQYTLSKALERHQLEVTKQAKNRVKKPIRTSVKSPAVKPQITCQASETSPILQGSRHYSYNSRVGRRARELEPARKVNKKQEAKLENSVTNLFDL